MNVETRRMLNKAMRILEEDEVFGEVGDDNFDEDIKKFYDF